MTAIVQVNGLSKSYGRTKALDDVSFSVEAGAITGLIGPNGAGKTTALKALLGLCDFDGDVMVAGHDPRSARHRLMMDVCFIADVGILPDWLKVSQAIEFVEGVHPQFDRARAEELLATTEIKSGSSIKALSKGMVTQLHLALVMAIDVRLLVLDEPTLGLDILYRKEFYDRLLNEYCDGERTVIVSTHQVEEIEGLLTQLLFIRHGRIVLDTPMDEMANRFVEVLVPSERVEQARALNPLSERDSLGRKIFLYDTDDPASLEALGETGTPSVADLFVGTMKGGRV